MYQILTLNKISATGLDRLPAEQYTHGNEIAQPDAIMVRSASMHEMEHPQKRGAPPARSCLRLIGVKR